MCERSWWLWISTRTQSIDIKIARAVIKNSELINHVAKEHYEDKDLIEYENEQDSRSNDESMLDKVVQWKTGLQA